MEQQMIGLAFFVLLAFISQALSGFGSIIIAVTLGSILVPIKELLPIVVPLDIFVSTYIVIRYRQYIHTELLIKRIFPSMLLGLLVGLLAFTYIQGDLLRRIYGAFVILISLRELICRSRPMFPLTRVKFSLYIFLAGFTQGLFASRGPLVAYAAGRMSLSKEAFRSTLCVVWLVSNVTLTLTYIFSGSLDQGTIKLTAILLPMMLLGGFTGEKMHARINERSFKIFIHAILTFAGIAILLF